MAHYTAHPLAPGAGADSTTIVAIANDGDNFGAPRRSVEPAPTKVGVDNVVSVGGLPTSLASRDFVVPILERGGEVVVPWVLTNANGKVWWFVDSPVGRVGEVVGGYFVCFGLARPFTIFVFTFGGQLHGRLVMCRQFNSYRFTLFV